MAARQGRSGPDPAVSGRARRAPTFWAGAGTGTGTGPRAGALLLPYAGRPPRLPAGSGGKFLRPGGRRRQEAGVRRRPSPGRPREAARAGARRRGGVREESRGARGPCPARVHLAREESPAQRALLWGAPGYAADPRGCRGLGRTRGRPARGAPDP